MRRPCLEPGCHGFGEDAPRCPVHTRAMARARNADQRPRRAVARAVRLELNGLGGEICAACRRPFPTSELEVDHRLALADGGTDTRDNLVYLCGPCHKAKTADEARARARRRRNGGA